MTSRPYATWMRSDVHVHTPFDGEKHFGAGTDSAIEAFKRGDCTKLRRIAADFYEACRKADLSIVGVTDHNTCKGFAYLKPYLEELNEVAVTEGDSRICFLPGVEVTAGSERPVHILLLFDEAVETTDIEHCLTLVFGPSERFDPATGSPRGTNSSALNLLDTVRTFCMPDTGERSLPYVVIPAHCQGESGLIKELRGGLKRLVVQHKDWNGFQAGPDWAKERDFLEMLAEWIAAKRGRDWSNLDSDERNAFRNMDYWPIVEASDPDRYEEIGNKFTWMKMDTSGLEGLRLALLDPQSRLRFGSIGCPTCDYPHITSLRARNTELFDDIHVDLSPQLNTLIGGRGTGKTSLLEYLRHGLDRVRADDFVGETVSMRTDLLKFLGTKASRGDVGSGTLLDDHEISVGLRVAHRDYQVTRTIEGIKVFQDGVELPASAIDVRVLIEPTIMSQREMASIARDPQAQRLVLDSLVPFSVRDTILSHRSEAIENLGAAQRERDFLAVQADTLAKLHTQLRKVDDQISALTAPGREAIIERQEYVAEGEAWLKKASAVLVKTESRLLRISEEIRQDVDGLPLVESPEGSWLPGVRTQVQGTVELLAAGLDDLAKTCADEAEKLADEKVARWDGPATDAREDYDNLVETLSAEGIDLSKRSELSNRRRELVEKIDALEIEAGKYPIRVKQVQQARLELVETYADMTSAREEVAKGLDSQAADVEIVVRPLHDSQALRTQHEVWFGGTGMRKSDWGHMVDHIFEVPGEVLDRLCRIVTALRSDRKTANDDGVGLSEQNSELVRLLGSGKLTGYYFTSVGNIEESRLNHMEGYVPDDLLEARFRDNDGTMKPIENGSLGQRSTAILAMLLGAGDQPLIIDQPEDDIDNRYVYDVVVEILRQKKFKRQIIVASHNANIPVNGDAEMIAVLGIDGGRGTVKDAGSIDRASIKDLVSDVMEGSREAFALRGDRYGY